MLLAHKICLDPNNVQATKFAKASGTARFAWNWALAEWQAQYKAGLKPNEMSLRKKLNEIKAEQFPWMSEVTKNAPQQAIKNLGSAFKNFFEKRGKYPRFKKKGVHDSFRADNGPQTKGVDAVALKDKQILLPNIGWVRLREPLRFKGQVKSAVVSRTAGKWFVSLLVEMPEIVRELKERPVAGVDLGIKALATLNDGTSFEGPKALRGNLKKLKRLSRALSRKMKGSANRSKARVKIAKLHARISNIRKDALHKATSAIAKNHSVIVLEDLNVRGMLSNGKLARAISDVGLFEFRRQIEYKAKLQGARVLIASRWYPSSKTCSECSCLLEALPLSVRDWVCPECGCCHDRDVNAAKNLAKLAVSSMASVCGEESSGTKRKPSVKLASKKQKSSSGVRYAQA